MKPKYKMKQYIQHKDVPGVFHGIIIDIENVYDKDKVVDFLYHISDGEDRWSIFETGMEDLYETI